MFYGFLSEIGTVNQTLTLIPNTAWSFAPTVDFIVGDS